jgi:general secretion pathway protein F
MNGFRYRAYSATGQIVQGIVEAESEAEALDLLHGRGIKPFLSGKAGEQTIRKSFWISNLRLADRAALAGQIAALLNAELPIDRVLRIVEQQAPSRSASRLVAGAIAAIANGAMPSAALSADGTGFAADEVGLIKAGEYSGSLAGVFAALSEMLAARLALRDKIASALLYPLILLAMTGLAIFVIATVLIPSIAPLFEQSGADLPLVIRTMNAAGEMINDHGSALLAIAFGICALCWAAFRSPGGRRRFDAAILGAPFIGRFARRAEAARLCRTLGVLLKNGARLQPALAAARDVARNVSTREALDKTIESIVGGQKLSPALADVAAFDPASRQLIAIGEEANKLDLMLVNAAKLNETALDKSIERFMALLTPVMTILLGALVGSLIISVMQAILSVNELALP